MTEIEIIKALLDKSKKNGYGIDTGAPLDVFVQHKVYYKFLFNHDFAKAIWGDVFVDEEGKEIVIEFDPKSKKTVFTPPPGMIPKYLYHLRGLALSTDHLAYLEKYAV